MTGLGQALLTVLIGAATFAIGQIVVKLCDLIFELRSLFGEIARDLLLYENRDDKIAEPQKRLVMFRSLAAALHEKVQKIVWSPVFELLGVATKAERVNGRNKKTDRSNWTKRVTRSFRSRVECVSGYT